MWRSVGAKPQTNLGEARLLLHWATQLVSAVGTSSLPARADFSHTNLVWDARRRRLRGRPIPSDDGRELRAELEIPSLSLGVRVAGESPRVFALDGKTLDEAREWLRAVVAESLGRELEAITLPTHDMPDHPVASGVAFASADHGPALAELEVWLHDAAELLGRIASIEASASEVVLWPHHLDMATLLTRVADDDPERAKTVGVGVSLGDGSYDQPYVYVTPWPYPAADDARVELSLGHWHADGFVAAVLTADDLVGGGLAGQSSRAESFVREAIGACDRLLGLPVASAPIRPAKLRWFKAAELDELPEGRVRSVSDGPNTVCLTHHDGCYAALTNACPHQGGPLGEGSIENGWLRCPWHGWDFDPLHGGSPEGLDDGLEAYAVEVRPDGVYVGVEEAAPHVRDASDVMAETMVAWGVRWVFGMVGHSNLGLADALRRRVDAGELGYVGVRHEGAAAFAVSAYGKLTGRPAAALAIAGPGATNLLTGLWDAHVDRAPALALTGQVASQYLGRGAFQEIDLVAAFGGVAEFTATVLHDSAFAELMSLACKSAILGRSVSHLVFPDEVQTLPVGDGGVAASPEGRMPDLRVSPSDAALESAVDHLRRAKRPAIIVGHGARFAMDEIRALAEEYDLPVITTFKAKGQISDHHPLGCGVLGRSGTPIASWFMNEADVLLVLGSSFSNHTGITDYKTIIQVDFEPSALGRRHPVAVPLLGEIGTTVAALHRRLARDSLMKPAPGSRGEVEERWAVWRAEKRSRVSDDGGQGINSAVLFDALTRHVPDDAIIAVDVGNNTYSFGRYFETRAQTILMSGYLGSIGFALPAAMGAWVATQERDSPHAGRKVVSVSGDGGLGQYLADLTTWVKHDMNITHVLLNNGELGKISKEQRAGGWHVWETGLQNPDFARFADNCGALGIRVQSAAELEGALARALGHEGPALVEVMTDALLF